MKTQHVLVVDDQENWREVLSSVLRDGGYEVDVAESVAKAWHLLNNNVYDVAILDVRLTDRNPYDIQGIELLDQMKAQLQDDCPVVIMTGYSFDGLEDRIRTQYRVRDFIKKGTTLLQDVSAFRHRIAAIMASPPESTQV